MVYCAQGRLGFTSAARRDAVLADLEARIAGRPRWGDSVLARSVLKPGGQPALSLELRFISKLDQADLLARVEAFATGTRTPVAGSWIELHDCEHDAGPRRGADCVPLTRRVW